MIVMLYSGSSQDDPKMILFADLVVDLKTPKDATDLWPAEPQVWVISKVCQYSIVGSVTNFKI